MNPYPQCFPQNEESTWTFEENKLFEIALALVGIQSPNLFESIAAYIPKKTIKQIRDHFFILVGDVELIESGSVPLPDYADGNRDEMHISATLTENKPNRHHKRKKGVPWTAEEHQLFLTGLEKHGKGDWKSVSKFIRSRTPSQVASHAQKYFLRLKKSNSFQTTSLASIFEPKANEGLNL